MRAIPVTHSGFSGNPSRGDRTGAGSGGGAGAGLLPVGHALGASVGAGARADGRRSRARSPRRAARAMTCRASARCSTHWPAADAANWIHLAASLAAVLAPGGVRAIAQAGREPDRRIRRGAAHAERACWQGSEAGVCWRARSAAPRWFAGMARCAVLERHGARVARTATHPAAAAARCVEGRRDRRRVFGSLIADGRDRTDFNALGDAAHVGFRLLAPALAASLTLRVMQARA